MDRDVISDGDSDAAYKLVPRPILGPQTRAHFLMMSSAFPLDMFPCPDFLDAPSLDSKSAPDDLPPGDTPSPPIISQSFIDRILWSSTRTSEPRPAERSPPVAFSDDLTTRVRASFEYAFYSAEKLSKTAFAGSVTLYCPVPLGNPILDSMLKLVADQVNADVIELDALELVAGSLGLDTTAIEVENNGHVPRSLYSSVPPGTDERKNLDAFFTALINVPSAHGTKRRFLYLRDIGSIAMSAKPLASVLLRAIQDNCKKDGVSTILLVFGVSAKRKTVENSNGPKAISSSRNKRDASPLLPPFSAKICGPDDMAVDNLPPLAFEADSPSTAGDGLMFLQFGADVGTSNDEETDFESEGRFVGDMWSTARSPWYMDKYPAPRDVSEANWIRSLYEGLQAVIKNTPVFVIEPSSSTEGLDRQCLKQHILKSRVESINRATMRIIARKYGACLLKEAEDTWVALARTESRVSDDAPRLSAVLPLSAVRLTVSIAIGLSSGEDISSEMPVLAPHHISQAHHLSQVAGRSKKSTNCADSTNAAPSGKSGQKRSVADRIAKLKSKHNLTDKEEMFISRIFQPDLLQKTNFSDVVIDPQVKEMLRSIISLPLLHPEQFSAGILAEQALSGVLLYGPPGTGKTLVCRALAVDFGVPMIIVQPSDILDKYYGESEKMAKAVFGVAHQIAPCIVFIDEVDAIFRARSSDSSGGGSDAHRSMLTEFMTAMDGIQTIGANGVVVIGATNRPFDLDAAILRRLPRRMIIDLPPATQRKEILELYLRTETCAAGLDINEIVRCTKYFSGSDLKNLCVTAALEAVNEAIAPTADLTNSPRGLRLIKQAHFTRALQLILPSFSMEANAELYGWHAKHI